MILLENPTLLYAIILHGPYTWLDTLSIHYLLLLAPTRVVGHQLFTWYPNSDYNQEA